ncbi:hypothetical protein ACX3YC_09505 [Pseudomonas mohnii]
MSVENTKESRVTQFVIAEDFADGDFREVGEGELFTDEFWKDVPVDVFHHQHKRVVELKGQLQYQYRFDGSTVYVRTLAYYLTSRPANSHWNRANLDIQLEGLITHRVNSPDAMSQNFQWHSYIAYANVSFQEGSGPFFNVRIEYDGKNNGVGETESWGNKVQLVRRP